jgi:hypothetical protein
MRTVLIYVNTSKDVGDVDHLKVFASDGRDCNERRNRKQPPEVAQRSGL